MAASKLTRVRSDFFSKSIAITRPGSSGSRSPSAILRLQIRRRSRKSARSPPAQIGHAEKMSHEQAVSSDGQAGVSARLAA